MDSQQLLDRLPYELRRKGLPASYIARYINELRERIIDLKEERARTMSKEALNDAEIVARIGSPDTLADAASLEFTRRSFSGRHPIFTFLVVPMPLAIVAWVATFAVIFGCGAGAMKLDEWLGAAPMADDTFSWPVLAILVTIFWLGVIGPPAALTMCLCRLARRNGLSWRWALAASAIVALTAGMFQAVLEPGAAGHGRLTFGFGLWLVPPLQQWLQFAFPMLIGCWLVWRQTRSNAGGTPPLSDASIPHRQAA